jgi:energy-coupling factor transporter ATP-binding protein EcfA2
MAHLISALMVTDFKRVREVKILPGVDRAAILIAGRNAQGKSSILDALDAAMRGKRAVPADAVRHGAGKADIIVEYDGGALVVHREISRDGATELEVRTQDGAVKRPQDLLDRLIGACFVDPVGFINQPPKAQREVLLQLIDREKKLPALEAQRERIFENRTEVGRDLKKAEGELARLPPMAELPEPIDVAALAAERAAFADKQRAGDGIGHAAKEATIARERAEQALAQNRVRIRELSQALAQAQAETPTLEANDSEAVVAEGSLLEQLRIASLEWKASQARRDAIDIDLTRANQHNRSIAAAEASIARRAAAETAVKALEAQRAEQTALLERIDNRKLEFLRAAQLPVEGLGVDAETITLNGVPFAQASAAEKLRVAMAIAIAANPQLDDIWVRDGALLDDDSLAAVCAHAAEHNKRPWVEVVGVRGDGCIVIRDGMIAAP